MQIDGLNELPEEKRPPELMIWDGSPEEVEKWLKDVFSNKKTNIAELLIDNVEK